MKVFFTKTFILTVSFLAMWGSASVVLAAAGPDIGLGSGGLTQQVADKGGYQVAGVNDTSLSASIGRVIRIALSFVGTIFFALTIYAGFLWMTAAGNEEQVTKAKDILKMAVIGLAITLASYGITLFTLIVLTKTSGAAGG